jgi:hypothetical protein
VRGQLPLATFAETGGFAFAVAFGFFVAAVLDGAAAFFEAFFVYFICSKFLLRLVWFPHGLSSSNSPASLIQGIS